MVISSCHFISAITHNDELHGVGLQSFENEARACVAHNAFITKNYNGMEMAAKVGGYVAPTLGALTTLWVLLECCRRGGFCGGKCLPTLMLMGASACQGITFLLFKSELFCSNKDIERCEMGDAGYRSMQSCLVYAFCFVLYYCGPTPAPFAPSARSSGGGGGEKKKKKKKARKRGSKDDDDSSSDEESGKGKKSSEKKKPSKKKAKSEPGKDEEWTREMYEQRRKEKKVKSRGVSGRSKKDIFDDLNKDGGGDRSRRSDRDSVSNGSYSKRGGGSRSPRGGGGGGRRKDRDRHRESSQPRYDDYVDTEPDGMDWSAYTPDQREAYYERQRTKKRERKERERERERRRSRSRSVSNSPRPREEEYSVISYNDRGGGGGGGRPSPGHEDSTRYTGHEDSTRYTGHEDSARYTDYSRRRSAEDSYYTEDDRCECV